MSTRSTIAYGKNFHLYHELGDEDFVYLELESVQFEAAYNQVMVPIPIHIWEYIRRYPGIDLAWADKNDRAIKGYVKNEVDERIKRHQAANKGNLGLTRILGSLVYGTADEPRDTQIENGMAHFRKVREHQKQIRKEIAKLERANPRNIEDLT